MVLKLKREHVLYIMYNRNGSGFKVITIEIYPNI